MPTKLLLGLLLTLVGVITFQAVQIHGFLFIKGLNEKLTEEIQNRNAELKAHKTTKQDYQRAQEDAQKLEASRLLAVLAEQERITDDISTNYKQRLDAVNARYNRMRGKLSTRAHPGGSTRDLSVPSVSPTSLGTDEASRDSGLSLQERLISTNQAIQLDEFITWAETQIKANPPPDIPSDNLDDLSIPDQN